MKAVPSPTAETNNGSFNLPIIAIIINSPKNSQNWQPAAGQAILITFAKTALSDSYFKI